MKPHKILALQAIAMLIVFIGVAWCHADEPQKYQVDFTLRYNAVDAEAMAKILVYLEQLKDQAGSVKLVPCRWDVKIKTADEPTSFSVIDGTVDTNWSDAFCTDVYGTTYFWDANSSRWERR